MERISELMDGELEARDAQRQLARLKQDKELAHCWSTFHLIGDALRGERPLAREISSRVAQQLANEPTVLAPRSYAPKRAATYAVSVAASLSAVALVAWIAFFDNPLAPQQTAVAPPALPALTATAVSSEQHLASVPSEGEANDLLRAHTDYSPSTAIQGLAPYIRSVSGTQQAKGR
jgi:sigma-E factor negative regulatory protein RseA